MNSKYTILNVTICNLSKKVNFPAGPGLCSLPVFYSKVRIMEILTAMLFYQL